MVQKKRKSKRQNPKSRYKLQKKVKAKIRADKKMLKKQEQKVPRHVLLTDEEKQIYEEQKISNELRQKNAIINKFDCKSDLEIVFENADILIEVVDVRDIYKKSTIERDHYVFLSKTDLVPEEHVSKCYNLLGSNVFDVRNIQEFPSRVQGKKIGIIGRINSGRNTLISKLSMLDVLDVVGSIGDSTDLSAVLRRAIDLDQIDAIKYVSDVLNLIDKSDLALHYEIPEFTTFKEFCNLMIEKHKKKSKLNIPSSQDVAKRFLHDLFLGKIMWYFEDICGDRKLHFNFVYK